MEYEKKLSKIREGIEQYQRDTMFIANFIKCNISSRYKISDLVNGEGFIEGTILKVIVDNDIEENTLVIGMGNGPHTSKINL